ncbi:MAG: EDR1-related protein [Verrucomicrobiota bacterium]
MTLPCRVKWLVLAALALCASLHAATPPALIEAGSPTVWQYLDDGSDPGPAWHAATFEAAGWKKGPAPLGYGQPGVATEIGFGGKREAKHLTAYFRHTFDVKDPAGAAKLAVSLRVDDGAVLYLNGQELVRSNLPKGPLTRTTPAQRRIDGPEEALYRRHSVPATLLVPGRNVLAVEVHQVNAASSDLFLDLSLQLDVAEAKPPAPRLPDAARDVSLLYLKKHYIPAGTPIPDGYMDGGRGMKIAADSTARSGREILVVDRPRDPELRQHLAYARSPEVTAAPPLTRAALLATYVDKQYSPDGSRRHAEAVCTVTLEPYRGRDILLGQVIRAGVCRHRSLLFKLLADECGLSVALVRGVYSSNNSDGNHAWNELITPEGEKLIVDVMNPRPNFEFPKLTDPRAAHYLTVDNKPWYPAVSAKE